MIFMAKKVESIEDHILAINEMSAFYDSLKE